jgi:hypothetical protein
MELDHLDDSWIRQFKKEDTLYQDFYKDDVYFVNLRVLYINHHCEIEKIKETSLLLSEKNKILQEELIHLIKLHSIDQEKRYSLLSMLKYNLLLNPDDVADFLKYNHEYDSRREKDLSIVKNIDHILFERTISTFQDLNELMLVFYEKEHTNTKNTNTTKTNTNNQTKKVFIRKEHKEHKYKEHKQSKTKTYKKWY